jgi:F-type H+-transporting ATPase subunit a
MAASGLHISISAETVFKIGEFAITNSILSSLIVSGLLIGFALAVRLSLSNTARPTGIQNIAEWFVEAMYSMVFGVTNSVAKTWRFLPLIATFFLFILFNNWLGLLPGVGTVGFKEMKDGSKEHAVLQQSDLALTTPVAQAATETHAEVVAPTAGATEVHAETHEAAPAHEAVFVPYLRAGTADLNTTLALALISVFMIQFYGVSYQGIKYFGKFFNFAGPVDFMIGLLELVLEQAKVISFAFRLFGNVFAGEVLLAVITHLGKVVVPMPFYGLEVAVGVIQAVVFAMLSVVFFNMATHSHSEA